MKLPYLCMLILMMTLATAAGADAQENTFSAGVHAGYNSYNLGQLSDFENRLSEDFNWPVPLEAVEEFPNFYSFGVSFSMRRERFKTAARYHFHSTGSRFHYADFSGETGFDTVLKANRIGFSAAFQFLRDPSPSGETRFYGGVAPGFLWGTYGLTEYVRLEESQLQDELEFTHRGVSSELFLLAERSIGRMILSLRGGYDISLYSRLYREGEEVALPGTDPGGTTGADMSGFRAGIGIEIML
ncbi:MAG: hypothetical protein GVY08_06730 [Bacteroidetes bacterium]|jgi:hypothetical protein|nr:hypothetical protein [Bacteroidota bacterium]